MKHSPKFTGCHGVLVVGILTIWKASTRSPLDQGHLIREFGSLSGAWTYTFIDFMQQILLHLHGFVPFFCGKYHGTQSNFFIAAFIAHSNLECATQ